jgi:hypothetical protein
MYITGIDPTDWSAEAKFRLGTLGASQGTYGIEIYRYVKLRNETATVAVAVGDVLGYLASPAAGEEYNTVVSDNTDAATKPIAAGVAKAALAGAQNTAYYGWVQCGGFAVVAQTLAGPPADGDALYLSTTDKTLTLATAADDPICAFAVDASEKLVRLNCV